MTEQPQADLRRSDVDDLRDHAATPAHSGSSGGSLAIDIGSEDELEAAEGTDSGLTRPHKADKVQPVPQRKTGHERSSF